jgi:pimeloyl-ACP methyl ester carboxylesterase
MSGRPAAPGGTGPGTIVFCHANGFPAGTYRQLFEAWRGAGHRVLAPEKFGHDPAYPVTGNWPRLRDQLIDFVSAQAPGQAVHLVGHSLGGLFKRVSPGRVSAGRRYQWPSAAVAYEHFAAKHAFARWGPGVLQDYVDCGVEPAPAGGVTLTFRREVETHIYNTLPHHIGGVLQRHPPRCPVAFIGGTRSTESRQAGLAAVRALAHGRIEWIEGSHLFPMEEPAETAAAVLRALA